jgi:hypothetical protein
MDIHAEPLSLGYDEAPDYCFTRSPVETSRDPPLGLVTYPQHDSRIATEP